MLLEIVLSVALFVFAAAVVGSAMHSAQTATRRMRLAAQAANLAQTVLADLASGRMELAETPETLYGAHEEDEQVDPDELGWTYEIDTEELSDATNLLKVTVIVRSTDPGVETSSRLTQWMPAPAEEAPADEGFDDGFTEAGR